jgi:hypothetical protein
MPSKLAVQCNSRVCLEKISKLSDGRILSSSAFWDVTGWRQVDVHRSLGEASCFHLQGRRLNHVSSQQEAGNKQNIRWTPRPYIPDDIAFHIHRLGDLKFNMRWRQAKAVRVTLPLPRGLSSCFKWNKAQHLRRHIFLPLALFLGSSLTFWSTGLILSFLIFHRR